MKKENSPARLVGPPLLTERQPNGMRRLQRDLQIEVDGATWTIPDRSLTDYSSIPSIGRLLVRWSQVDLAGVLHDHLYRDPKQTGGPEVSRWRADRIWRLVAVSGDTRANPISAWLCWAALSAYGGIAWGMARKRNLIWPLAQAWLTSALLSLPLVFLALRYFELDWVYWAPTSAVLATWITHTTYRTVKKSDPAPE